LAERHHGGPPLALALVRFPERAQLRFGRRDRFEGALLPQLVLEPLAQDGAALALGQPASPLLGTAEPGESQLPRLISDATTPRSSVLDRLLHFLLRHLHRRVTLGLLDEQLHVDQGSENAAPQRVASRRILRHHLACRLRLGQLFFELRREYRSRPDDGHDPIHRHGRLGARRHRQDGREHQAVSPPRGQRHHCTTRRDGGRWSTEQFEPALSELQPEPAAAALDSPPLRAMSVMSPSCESITEIR
jgi:hypothetical protein